MKKTAVEWLVEKLDTNLDINHSWRSRQYIEQAEQMDKKQKAEEYLKGFKDGKEYQIKLDELTFKTK